MVIVADSGTTKTDWIGAQDGRICFRSQTIGLNPVLLSSDQIREEIANGLELPSQFQEISHLYFYGSGCSTVGRQAIIHEAVAPLFTSATIQVNHDLIGAARAASKSDPGVICILGTGSNCCLYDGKKLIDHMFSLGYLLGDEGAGVDLGKRLIQARYYHGLPSQLEKEFDEFFQEHFFPGTRTIVDVVYKSSSPPKTLASFVPFMVERKEQPEIKKIVNASFDNFLNWHVLKYPETHTLPVHFVGSVACLFKDIMLELLQAYKLIPGNWIQRPIEALVEYHHTLENEKQHG